MIRSFILRFAAWGAVISTIDSALPTQCRAERVGYAFQGSLTPSFGQTYKLFGVTVPNNAPITGTFSYDTTAIGVDSSVIVGAKEFKQVIHGGFTWNVLNAASQLPVLQLAAHEYSITVANNYPAGASYIDHMSIDFSSLTVPPPPPIWVNGAPYTGTTAVLSAKLSWDSSAFNDEDDPKLRAQLPLDSFVPYLGAARSGSPAAFTITSFSRITPIAGDLNIDGRASISDYFEWRKAFGGTSQAFAYADANTDGVIDACDYVLWRKAATTNGAAASVPEPPAIALTAIAAAFFTRCRHYRRLRCRRRKPC